MSTSRLANPKSWSYRWYMKRMSLIGSEPAKEMTRCRLRAAAAVYPLSWIVHKKLLNTPIALWMVLGTCSLLILMNLAWLGHSFDSAGSWTWALMLPAAYIAIAGIAGAIVSRLSDDEVFYITGGVCWPAAVVGTILMLAIILVVSICGPIWNFVSNRCQTVLITQDD